MAQNDDSAANRYYPWLHPEPSGPDSGRNLQ